MHVNQYAKPIRANSKIFYQTFFSFKLNYKRLNLELGIRNHYDIDFYVILKNINFGTIKFQILLQNITC